MGEIRLVCVVPAFETMPGLSSIKGSGTMAFNRETFLAEVKHLFGGSYKTSQTDGMTAILDEWDKRKPDGDVRWLGYMFATAFHETAQQMQPVKEAFWLSENWRQHNLPYYPYYGRGYVQLTHRDNYKKAGDSVGEDLVTHADRALNANIAAAVMFVGMEEGWFRSSKDGRRHNLGRYFSHAVDNPVGARNVINGKEWKKVHGKSVLLAETIAQYHRVFLEALNAATSAPVVAAVAAHVAPPEAMAAGDAAAAAHAAAGFATGARDFATAEWEFFGKQTYDLNGNTDHAGHTEGENPWYKRIGNFWEEGTHTHGLDGRNHESPWSATFISWVMRKAGAGARFRYSIRHAVYISQGIRDFLEKRDAAGYWAMRLSETKPELGDLVCWGREAGVDYDHQKGGDYAGHSDVVVAVEAEKVWIIGGNVGNSVTRRPLKLDPSGHLVPIVQHGENLFAILKNRIA